MKARLKNKWITVESQLQAVQIAEAHELDSGVELDTGYVITAQESQAILYPDIYIFENGGVREKTSDDILKEEHRLYLKWLNDKHDEFSYKALGNPSTASPAGWPRNLQLAEQILAGEESDELTAALNAKLTDDEKAQDNAFLFWAAKVVYVKAPFTKFVYDEAEGVKRYGEKLGESITVENSDDDIKSAFNQAKLALTIKGLGQEYIDSNKQNIGGRMLAAMQYLDSLKQAFPEKFAKHLAGES